MFSFNVVIIGCGKMSANHVEKVLQYVPPINIALCDSEILKARLLGDLYQIENIYDSLEDLIDNFKPDIFHIVTPPATHKKIAIQCMEAGGHIYIEKPICLNVDDFNEIQETAERTQKLVCAGHQRLFEKHYSSVKKSIENGKLGRIIHIHGYDSGPYLEMEDQGLSRVWWRDLTGGMYIDLLPHIVGIFNDLVSNTALQNALVCYDSRGRSSELHGFYRSPSTKQTSSFHISFGTKFFQNYIQIECERGVIVLNLKNNFHYILKKTGLPELLERLVIYSMLGFKIVCANTLSMFSLFAGRYDPYEGIGELIKRFYHAVLNNEASPTPLADVRRVVSLCEETIQTAFPKEKSIRKQKEIPENSHPASEVEVLVTGGTGFIGTHLVQRLLRDGKKVRVISRREIPEKYFGTGFASPPEILVGDLRNTDFLQRACQSIKTIYHLAAATKGDLFTQVESTCIGTKNLLQAIQINPVERLVYVSSVSILDQTNYPKDGIVDENFPFESEPLKRGAYTYAKLRAEEMVLSFINETKNVKTVIIRPGIVWGPGSVQRLLETNFRIGKRFSIVLGQKKKKLPLVYIENLVDALVKAGNAESVNSDCFNIVDDNNPTQREYLQVLKEITGKRDYAVFIPISITLPLFWVCQKILGHMLRKPLSITYQMRSKNNRAVYSLEHAQNALGFNSKISFREGLITYCDWLRQKENVDQ